MSEQPVVSLENQLKIQIKNFSFFYGKKQVLFNLNLEIPKNNITGIFGPAGSGISTLLRSLNRLCDLIADIKVEGEILLDGVNIFDPGTSIIELRRRVGMVFDVPVPLPMSVFDNVAYGLRLKGIKKKKLLEETIEEALTKAALWDDVKDRLNIPGTSLSGGQQQRLCIARILALKPELILLDRPCSGLDPISTAKIEDSLGRLKEKFTIVIAPHNVQQAGRVCDKAVFMLMGHLIEQGPTREIFTNPKDTRTNDYITGRFG